MGRPRGKKYHPINIMLTEEQIKYLEEVPNASELIRELLSRHMEESKIIAEEEKQAHAQRGKELESLWEQYWKLKQEFDKFFRDIAPKYYERWDSETKENILKPDTPPNIVETYKNFKRKLAELKSRIGLLESQQ